MELQSKILNACREEVAKEYGFTEFASVPEGGNNKHHIEVMDIADKRAMDRLAEFYKWILLEDEWQLCLYKGNLMYVERAHSEDSGLTEDFFKTELELYNIWRGE